MMQELLLLNLTSVPTLQKQLWHLPTKYSGNQLSQIAHLIKWILKPLMGLSTHQGGILPLISMC